MSKLTLFLTLLLVSIATVAQQEQNLMSSKFTPQELQKVLIPQAKWTPFPRLNDRAGWAKADASMLDANLKSADEYLEYTWPTVPATLSLLIARTGNRNQYEAVSFGKRRVLASLLMAEIAENKGRFVDQIINGVWSICEESWWGASAHLPQTAEISGLMDVSQPFVDLFAAETGALLSWVDYYLGDKFDAVSPQIRKRIYNEVNYRLMQPLMNQYHGWMGKNPEGRGPNNWNPWICSNWINFVLLLEKDDARRATMIHKALQVLDEFINPYNMDGGCDEGPSYWGAAAASLYDNVSLLNLASNDAFSYVYNDERFRNMGRFIFRAQIGDEYFLNFADAGPRVRPSAAMVYRYGKDIKDKDMMEFGAYYRRTSSGRFGNTHFFRVFFELFMQEEFQNTPKRLPFPKDVWLPDLQVMIARDKEGASDGFFVAAKGGHNAESHNHNDIGNFVVFYDGQPLLLDVGSGRYTLRTFNDGRYGIWFNCSDYHNTVTVNGVTQNAGMKYRASNISYKPGKSTVGFSSDIAQAYPPEAGINSWIRTVTLNRGKGVQVKDVTDLNKTESVTQHLMTCYPVEVTSPGIITIHYKNKDGKEIDFTIKYNARQMTAKIEKVILESEEDQGVRGNWGDTLQRINFEVTAPKAKDSYLFEIRKK